MHAGSVIKVDKYMDFILLESTEDLGPFEFELEAHEEYVQLGLS